MLKLNHVFKLPSGNYGNSEEAIDNYIKKVYDLNKQTLDKYIINGISRDRFVRRIKTIMREEDIDKKMAVIKFGNNETFISKSERAWQNIRKFWSERNMTRKVAARLGALDNVSGDDITWNPVEHRYEVRIRARYAGQKDYKIWFNFSSDMYDFVRNDAHWGYVV